MDTYEKLEVIKRILVVAFIATLMILFLMLS